MDRAWALRRLIAGGACLMTFACGGSERESREPESAGSSAASGSVQPGPGGRVIEVEMYSNEKGNYFEPREITARPGDVVSFELKIGVHNVNFFPDSNPGKSDLPPASPMLQLPDQTYDLLVTLKPGRYYFQCDPHALLGMIGHLTVGP